MPSAWACTNTSKSLFGDSCNIECVLVGEWAAYQDEDVEAEKGGSQRRGSAYQRYSRYHRRACCEKHISYGRKQYQIDSCVCMITTYDRTFLYPCLCHWIEPQNEFFSWKNVERIHDELHKFQHLIPSLEEFKKVWYCMDRCEELLSCLRKLRSILL